MSRSALGLMVCAIVVSGCASAEVTPGAVRSLPANAGWLVLACDSERRVESVTMCRPRTGQCETVGPFHDADQARVLALPIGRWCVRRLVIPHGGGQLIIRPGSPRPGSPFPCTVVDPARTTYPGHISVRNRSQNPAMDELHLSFVALPERARAALAFDYRAVLAAWAAE